MGNYNWLTFVALVFGMICLNLRHLFYRHEKIDVALCITIDILIACGFFLQPLVNGTVMDKWFNFSLFFSAMIFLSIEFVLAGFPKKYTIPILVIVDIAALCIAIHKIF